LHPKCAISHVDSENNEQENDMKKFRFMAVALSVVLSMVMTSCLLLRGTSVVRNGSLSDYKYFYVIPTAATSSVYGATVGNNGITVGGTTSSSVVPSDLIAGHFVKKGYVRVADIKPETANQTLSVSYSETNMRRIGATEATEVTIQMVNGATNALVCTVTAEGKSNTNQAEEVRMAIDRAMKEALK